MLTQTQRAKINQVKRRNTIFNHCVCMCVRWGVWLSVWGCFCSCNNVAVESIKHNANKAQTLTAITSSSCVANFSQLETISFYR